jgi:hypothetical protein
MEHAEDVARSDTGQEGRFGVTTGTLMNKGVTRLGRFFCYQR